MQKIVIAKAVILDNQDRVLLIRRSKTAPRRPLEWDLPGGFVDEGDESYQTACLRELQEETGLEATKGSVHLGYTESHVGSFPQEEVHDVSWLYFTANSASAEVHLSYEHDKSTWVSLDRALELIVYERQLRALAYIKQAREMASTGS